MMWWPRNIRFFKMPVIKSQGPAFKLDVPLDDKYQSICPRPLVRIKTPGHRPSTDGARRFGRRGRV